MIKASKTGLCFLFLIIIVIAAYFGFNALNKNFHIVIDGQVYRSAQPKHEDLFRDLNTYKIKAIINMRGAAPNASWFQHEAKFAKKHGIMLYNINVPAHGLPSIPTLRKLVHVLQVTPRPYLIHCLAGVNRTGLASAISVILSGDPSTDDWQDQLSWQYNLLSRTSIGYQVMQNYMHWLQDNHFQGSKTRFLEWASSVKELKHYTGWFFT